jgi:hypothetical protein
MPGTAQVIAGTTLLSAVVITVADAPNWQVESYIGLLAAMSGVAILSQASPEVAKSMAILIAVVMVLQRGQKTLNVITGWAK